MSWIFEQLWEHVSPPCKDLSVPRWEGKDQNEIGRCKETGVVHVRVHAKYFRPTEVVSHFSSCVCVCVCVCVVDIMLCPGFGFTALCQFEHILYIFLVQ